MTRSRDRDVETEILDVDELDKPDTPVEPKIILKGARSFRTDLFKAEVASYRKNTSWKFAQPKLENVEHCHFFHTYDSNGRPQTKTNSVGGHYHEIKWKVDQSGELVAECGPPIVIMDKDPETGKRFRKPRPKQLAYYSANANDGEGGLIVDNHTHTMRYVHSEELNQDTIRAKQRQAGQYIERTQASQG